MHKAGLGSGDELRELLDKVQDVNLVTAQTVPVHILTRKVAGAHCLNIRFGHIGTDTVDAHM